MAHLTHTKVYGYVEEIAGESWRARLFTEDGEYEAMMTLPYPAHAAPGSPFTIHITKAGAVYIYWITTPWTKRQLKKARQRAREYREWFFS